jgi:hypothetical protein
MRSVLAFALTLVCLPTVLGQAAKPSLKLEAAIDLRRPDPTLNVKLTNTSNGPISVATKNLQVSYDVAADKSVAVVVGLMEKRMDEGRLIVPAASSLDVVTLDPGEVAVFSTSLRYRAMAKAGAKARVRYEVSEFWGKRFKVWYGKVEAEAPVTPDTPAPKKGG